MDFIYVDSPCFAHVLSNTPLETTNFEPCSFRFCKFETSWLNKASFCTKQFTGGFIDVDLYTFTSMLDERIQIYKKIHVIVASVAQGPPGSSKKKSHQLQFFSYSFWRVQDGCTTVPPYWAILLIFQNSSIHHLGCKKRKLSDVSMVGYSLLTLAVSCSINFRVWKNAPRKFDLEKWWTWRVQKGPVPFHGAKC